MGKEKSDLTTILAVLVVIGVIYFLFIAPSQPKTITPAGEGSPSVVLGCSQKVGTTADGYPLTKQVDCGSLLAVIGGIKVDYGWLDSTVAVSGANFQDVTITASSSGGVNAIAPVKDVTAAWENGAVPGARVSPQIASGGSYTFSTRTTGPTGTACGTWTASCDANEIKTYDGIANRCECVFSIDEHTGNPREFTVAATGTFFVGDATSTVTPSPGLASVVIEPNPQGSFTISVNLFSRR